MHPAPIMPALTLAVAACATAACSPPDDSGLIGVRPYPQPGDVCKVIGEHALTNRYLDHTALLVGCPADASGAIADRLAEGGRTVAQAGHWTLISIPQN